ncbi:TIGR03083 family protein [Streptomyces sp. DvalAA-14]|uniref:maleylpyruvate isomerase family mycothiol-dependent enzyme n=1 Tax=unclassified Streptomyces TaxID=2593676 RepID=UPI00081AF0F1|nr:MULTISPECIES: maleylpyruvate isomerase family mycothiol-dependent enzyme [unclassified Streptomyces]MYS21643.1 maleylpyruvate isomerase family mycothiol-dependent enzyme [Streptomyces sp. SID4948]SCD97551.1 TIGR03083 family protein [Streptomyces sp. DvalAA-14]
MSTPDWQRAPHHLAYRFSREYITALLAERPQDADLPVPACPGWSVRDVVVHLLGICRSVAELPADGPEPGSVAGEDAAPLLAAWERVGAVTEGLLENGTRGGNGILVMDALSHELDIRRALAVAPPAEHPSYPTALAVVTGGFSASVRGHGLPPLLIETPGTQWTAGAGRPQARWSGPRHDLLRSLSGRRSAGQISAMTWSQDSSPWLHAFRWGPFSPPQVPVE